MTYEGLSADDRRQLVKDLLGEAPASIDLQLAAADELRYLDEYAERLRQLVIEAYRGDTPTNGWRYRAESLDAWPGALAR